MNRTNILVAVILAVVVADVIWTSAWVDYGRRHHATSADPADWPGMCDVFYKFAPGVMRIGAQVVVLPLILALMVILIRQRRRSGSN